MACGCGRPDAPPLIRRARLWPPGSYNWCTCWRSTTPNNLSPFQGTANFVDIGTPYLIGISGGGPSGTVSADSPTFQWTPVVGATGDLLTLTDTSTSASTTSLVPGGDTSFTISGTQLNSVDHYTWQVAAIDANITGSNSLGMFSAASPFSYIGPLGGSTLEPPTATSTQDSSTAITFNWSAVNGATSYAVVVTDDTPVAPSPAQTFRVMSATSLPVSDASFTLGHQYEWEVCPLNLDEGIGPHSNVLQFTAGQAPTITTTTGATTFTVGIAGNFSVTASGTQPIAFGESGGLPSGVTFTDSTGLLSGTPVPNSGGNYPMTFTASNALGASSPQSFLLTVNQPPAITSLDSITLVAGQSGSFQVTATGFPTPNLVASGSLDGLTFNPSTGVLSGVLRLPARYDTVRHRT